MRAAGLAAALAIASWLGLTPAQGATFILDDGSTIAGSIVQATRNTLTIRPALGGLRQIPLGRLERVEITTADGQTLRGRYRGWAGGRSLIEVGTDLLALENDRVVERRSLATGALAASTVVAPLPSRPAPAAGPAVAAMPAGDLPVVSVKTSPDEITGSSGAITFTVELSRPLDDLLVVIYSTVDGTARAGADYEPRQGILTLPAGVTSAAIQTPLIDDARGGGNKDFQLFLASNPDLVTIAEPWTKITIHDD